MKTECPHCGQHYEVENKYNGAEAECDRCQKTFIIAPRWSSLLNGLNKEQIDAVTAPEGFCG